MLAKTDASVGLVVQALRNSGMWEQTLIVVTSDNGGPISANMGGNNWPLRGGKATPLEGYSLDFCLNCVGGIRVNAFVSGGFLPKSLQGTTFEGLVAMEDWYPTLCALAHADPYDSVAAAAGLPPFDGFDLSPIILGKATVSPRSEFVIGGSVGFSSTGATVVQGIIRSDGWKLLIGTSPLAFWQAPVYPNNSKPATVALNCGDPWFSGYGCLFNVFNDPYEQAEISMENPSIVAALRQKIFDYQMTVYSPNRGTVDANACATAMSTNLGYMGPWLT
jgi:arylsulfatase I/J